MKPFICSRKIRRNAAEEIAEIKVGVAGAEKEQSESCIFQKIVVLI